MNRFVIAIALLVRSFIASASDPVAVQVERHPPPHCLEPVPGVPCLVGHTPGKTPGAGDDTL